MTSTGITLHKINMLWDDLLYDNVLSDHLHLDDLLQDARSWNNIL
jgi:hypothetical protein